MLFLRIVRAIADTKRAAYGAYMWNQRYGRGTLKIISGSPHGRCSTPRNQVNSELLAFFKGTATAASV
jgi:hypothetical protein